MARAKNWSLNTVLLLQFLLVAAIPIAVTTALALWVLAPRLDQSVQRTQQALARSISGHVQSQLANAASDMQLLVSLMASAQSSEATQKLMDRFASNQSFYEAIYLANDSGEVLTVGLPADQQFLRDNFIGLDMSRKDFFQQVKVTRNRQWSGTFLSAVGGRLSTAYSLPAPGGILIGEIAVDQLPTLVADLACRHQLTVMIVDQNGNLIAHPLEALSQQQINLSHLDLIQEGQAGKNLTKPFVFNGQKLYGSSATLLNPRWTIIAAQPESILDVEQNAVMGILFAALFFGLLGAVVTATIAAKVFSGRFSSHAEQARMLAAGDYRLPLPQSTRIREFHTLGTDLVATGLAIADRERELKIRQDRFRALVEQSPLAIIEWDTDFNIRVVNALARKYFRIDENSTYDQDRETPLKRLEHAVSGQLARMETGSREFTILDDDENEVVLMAYNTIVNDEQGALLGYLCLLQDISRQRATENQIRLLNADLEFMVENRTRDLQKTNQELQDALQTLRHAQSELIRSEKLAALGSLVAGIAHELNTPIGNSLMATTSMKEQAELITESARQGELKKSQFDHFLEDSIKGTDIVYRNLNRASELIRSFKQVAVDQSSSQKRRFVLDRVIQEVITTLHPILKKSIALVSTDIKPGIHLDSFPGPLGQVITNLIQNALIHAFDGRASGTILISAHCPDAFHAEISISDDGVGIKEDAIDSIFDPFYTTKLGKGGSGLGLNIVHNLVHNILQGQITVSSKPGRGAKFVLLIPLVVQATEPESSELKK